MRQIKLEDLDRVYICDCGVLLHIPTLREWQYDIDKKRQSYVCPTCKREVPEEP